MLNKSMRDRLLSGAVWNFLGVAATRGFHVLSGIVVARMLGAELFGEVGVIQNSIVMFQVFASFGISLTCSKYVAELKKTDPFFVGGVIGFSFVFSLLSSFIVGLLLFILSPMLANDVLNRSELVEPLRLSSLFLVLSAWGAVQTGTLSGLEAFRSQSFANFLSGMLTFLCVVIGSYFLKTNGFVLGMIFGAFIQCCINLYILKILLTKYKIKIHLENFNKQFRLVYKFSMPAMMAGLIHWASIWVGNALLVNQNDGYFQMGVYNASYQWFGVLLFLPSILTNTILPIMSERKGQKNYSEMKQVLVFSIKSSFKLILPICIIISIFSPYIMSIYGNNFSEHWPVLIVMITMSLFACIQNMIGNAFAVIDKMWLHFNLNFLWGCLFVCFAYLILPLGYGAFGLALAGLFAYVIRFLISIFMITKELNTIS